MTDVVSARDAYMAARAQAAATRLELGRAIADARVQNVPQEAIAKQLGLTREQIRRYQREYERSLELALEHAGA
jgi:RimJ/RimL family protein N-acetyltransferase